MYYDLCRHLKTNGTQCKSPALTDRLYCFFHERLHQRHAGFRHTESTRGYIVPGKDIQLAPLEDRESVQVALSMIINALALGQIETRRATALLYGLQLASANARRLDLEPLPDNVARAFDSTPDDLSLAQPGATVEIISDEEYDALENEQDEDYEEADEQDEIQPGHQAALPAPFPLPSLNPPRPLC